MPPDYSKGKIYKVMSDLGDEVYIGSTVQSLCDRFGTQKSVYKRWKESRDHRKYYCFELFDKYGIENCKIILLESVCCSCKEELTAKEQQWIDKTDNCINKYRATTGINISVLTQPKEYRKAYRQKYIQKE